MVKRAYDYPYHSLNMFHIRGHRPSARRHYLISRTYIWWVHVLKELRSRGNWEESLYTDTSTRALRLEILENTRKEQEGSGEG